MRQLEHLTVGALLRRTAKKFPQRPALEYKGRVWTYEELDGEVDRMARLLLGWGVKRGDHLGIWCEAEPNTVFIMYAAVRIGAFTALINTSLHHAALSGILERSDITRLIISDGYKDLNYPSVCQGLKEELSGLKSIVYSGISGNNGGFMTLKDLEPGIASEEALAQAESQVTPEDIAYIVYTSGTTSFPKAVLQTHFSQVNVALQTAAGLEATEEDRFCAALPLFHCFGLSVNMLSAGAVGGSLYLPESRRTVDLMRAVSEGSCTMLSCVPTMYSALLHRDDFKQWDVSSVRAGIIGGSTYTHELFDEIEEGFGMTLVSSLGMSETSGGMSCARLDDPKEVRMNTLGHFLPHMEGKIIDIHTGEILPPNQLGEICVRGFAVMQGYYNQPEETAKALDKEGWLHTGDMGFIDEGGALHLTGRLKEMIIRGGENISPSEIEDAVAGYEPIDLCKVVGVPDPFFGEEVCMCIVPREGMAVDEEVLRSGMKERLASFKVPKYILLLDSMPTTPTGKIRPQEVKKIARERLGL